MKRAGVSLGQQLDARLRRVDALAERVEVLLAVAVEHTISPSST